MRYTQNHFLVLLGWIVMGACCGLLLQVHKKSTSLSRMACTWRSRVDKELLADAICVSLLSHAVQKSDAAIKDYKTSANYCATDTVLENDGILDESVNVLAEGNSARETLQKVVHGIEQSRVKQFIIYKCS
jgi:hypothetical protein